jgi:hypothetical protein
MKRFNKGTMKNFKQVMAVRRMKREPINMKVWRSIWKED